MKKTIKYKNNIIGRSWKEFLMTKEVIITIIAIITALILLLGSSYAIFTMIITSNKEHTVTSGILSIKFEENSEIISLNNTYPMTDEEGLNTKSYNIKITNTGTLDAKYRISLKDDSSIKNIVPKNLLKLSYKEGPNNYINPILISSLESEAIIVKDKILAVKTSINYEFKIWLDISAGNEVQEKSYKSKIVVESIPLSDDYSDTISPVLKLNGELNNNLLKGEVFTDLGIESVRDNKDTLNKDNVIKSYEYFNGTTTTIIDNINTNNLGIYFIYYKISDTSGNTGIVVRTVNINNTTPPTINLIANATIELLEGTAYLEQGVTAINNKGENISSKVLTLGSVNYLKARTYILKYISIDSDNNMSSTIRTINVIRTTYIFDYTGASQMFTVPRNGTYKIELWGAQGGNFIGTIPGDPVGGYIGGRGAYTTGDISFNANENIYLYIGGKGNNSDIGGYNGGGSLMNGQYVYGSSGGGATDIRLTNGLWDNFESLKSRIMVAAGGGGANNRNFRDQKCGYGAGDGGAGGALVGLDGQTINHTNSLNCTYGWGYGTGGEQIIGGSVKSYNAEGVLTANTIKATFGVCWKMQSGGGSGYYGGGSSSHGGSGGGSSFISGYTGCNAIASDSTSTNIIHTNQPNHYSNKVFTNSQMIVGNTSMPNPRETGNIIGNTGNGYAKITLIGLN